MADIIIGVLLVLMFIAGFGRGVGRQIWALAALCLSAYLAGRAYPLFLNITERFIAGETTVRFVTFAVVFGIISAVLNAPADAVLGSNRERKREKLGFGDRMAGGVLGVFEGIGSIEVFSALVLTYPVLGWDGWIAESSLVQKFLTEWPYMLQLLPSEFQHVLELF